MRREWPSDDETSLRAHLRGSKTNNGFSVAYRLKNLVGLNGALCGGGVDRGHRGVWCGEVVGRDGREWLAGTGFS